MPRSKRRAQAKRVAASRSLLPKCAAWHSAARSAAKEIKGLIQDTLEKVEKGSELVNRSGATLQGIVGSVKRVTDIVGEIAAASGEQSTGIEQVNTAMTQMDQVTQSNSAETEELSSTAQLLSAQSARLLELVSTFTLGNSSEASHAGRGSSAFTPGAQEYDASPCLRRPAKQVRRQILLRTDESTLTPAAVLVGGPAARSMMRASKNSRAFSLCAVEFAKRGPYTGAWPDGERKYS